MKVAILSPYSPVQIDIKLKGDIRPTTWTGNLINELSKYKNIELHLVTGISPRYRKIKNHGILNHIHYHFFMTLGRFSHYVFYLYEILRIMIILRNIEPDIVHGQGLETYYGLAAILSGYPYLITIHGVTNEIFFEKHFKHFINKILERFSIKRAKNIIAISPYIIKVLKKYSKNEYHRKNIFNIPNPVSEHFFQIRREINTEEVNVIYCGAFRPRKGLIDLLNALKYLEENGRQFNFYITGIIGRNKESQNYYNKIVDYIKKNIKNNVYLLGYVNSHKLAKLFKKMDLIVLPSKAETAPMVISEAMASSLPVIASNVGGIKYMIEDNITGYVVEKNNVKMLAHKIGLIIANGKLRRVMSKNAYKKATELYNPKIIAKRTLDAYNYILSGK